MITKYITLLLVLFSCVEARAQSFHKVQIKAETLPEGQLTRVHVSGRNGDSAALLQRSDGYWVYLGQTLYGPFETTDLLNASPFVATSDLWQFRAAQGGREVLVVNGVTYGPFDYVWTPNTSKDGRHWGALTKSDGRYATLVDGKISDSVDLVFCELLVEPPALEAHSECTAPFFYGSADRWVAIGYRKGNATTGQSAEFHLLTNHNNGATYDQVDDLITDPGDLNFGHITYSEFLTADGESFVASVHSRSLASDENYLWINQKTYGPYQGYTTRRDFLASRDMADDGSNWVIQGQNKIYTKDKVFAYDEASGPTISCNGKSISFFFLRDGRQYTYVNGREIGPAPLAHVARLSATGEHWLVPAQAEDGSLHYTSESGSVYGPYFTAAPFVFYRNENWIGFLGDESGASYIINNGHRVAGPFHGTLFDPSSARVNSRPWYYVGYHDGKATLIINGQVRFEQSGVQEGAWGNPLLSDDGSHWTVTGIKPNGTFFFADDGRVVDGLTRPLYTRLVSSQRRERNGLILGYREEDRFVINGREYGPYFKVSDAILSSGENAWAVAVLNESGSKDLILPNAPPVTYDEVIEMKEVPATAAVIYNGLRDGRCFPGMNGVSLGNYNQASINCGPDGSAEVYLTVNEGDRVLKTFKIDNQE